MTLWGGFWFGTSPLRHEQTPAHFTLTFCKLPLRYILQVVIFSPSIIPPPPADHPPITAPPPFRRPWWVLMWPVLVLARDAFGVDWLTAQKGRITDGFSHTHGIPVHTHTHTHTHTQCTHTHTHTHTHNAHTHCKSVTVRWSCPSWTSGHEITRIRQRCVWLCVTACICVPGLPGWPFRGQK